MSIAVKKYFFEHAVRHVPVNNNLRAEDFLKCVLIYVYLALTNQQMFCFLIHFGAPSSILRLVPKLQTIT